MARLMHSLRSILRNEIFSVVRDSQSFNLTSIQTQADHPLLVGAVVDWNLSNDLLLFIEEIYMNNTTAIICSKMQNLKQIFW